MFEIIEHIPYINFTKRSSFIVIKKYNGKVIERMDKNYL